MEVITEATYLARLRRSECSRGLGDNSGWMRDAIERHREAASASMGRTTTARTAHAMDALTSLERRVEQLERAAADARAAPPRGADVRRARQQRLLRTLEELDAELAGVWSVGLSGSDLVRPTRLHLLERVQRLHERVRAEHGGDGARERRRGGRR